MLASFMGFVFLISASIGSDEYRKSLAEEAAISDHLAHPNLVELPRRSLDRKKLPCYKMMGSYGSAKLAAALGKCGSSASRLGASRLTAGDGWERSFVQQAASGQCDAPVWCDQLLSGAWAR